MRAIIVSLIVMLCAGEAIAQCPWSPSNVLDGNYVEENSPTRKVVEYASLVERDVTYSKRVWRVIDLREKINQPMYFPTEPTSDRTSLWDVIKCSLLNGGLTAYDPGPMLDDDQFSSAYTPSEVQGLMSTMEKVPSERLDGSGIMDTIVVYTELESYSIKKYMIKEDWFFDRQRSVMDVRIIGIAPMKEVLGEDGELRGYAPVFWLYFPELRYTLANAKVYNRQNDVAQMTFDDLFWKRMFSSYIVKESNVFDRNVNTYLAGKNALFESERIKEGITRMESDMWHY